MENRTCAKCLKWELEQEDSAFFKKGDVIRPMFNYGQCEFVLGGLVADFVWSKGIDKSECFCNECILEMCRKHKTVRKGRPKKEKGSAVK